MRWVSGAIVVLLATFGAYKLGQRHPDAATARNAKRTVLYYVDPMHPSYHSDKPGIAPDCGMALVPVYARQAGVSDAAESTAALPEGSVSIDGATQQLLGIRTSPVQKSGSSSEFHAIGRVIPEDTRIYSVNSGVDGFIRQTYNDSVGTFVKKDQKLATYYSPDFLAATSGFLAANERIPGSVTKEGARSIQNYTDRLRNLGMSDLQIKQISESKQLPESVEILAPADGFIIARNITAGQHFLHDIEFYRLADLSHVWIAAEVDEQDAAYLHPGLPVHMNLRERGRSISARVTDSLPQSEVGGGTVKIRLEADNPQFLLRPEMLVDVQLPISVPAAVTVPVDAVLDSGNHSRVYIARNDGLFEPREVSTGWRSADRVQILRGVMPGEHVVTSATFLVDSESRLKAALPAPGAEQPSVPTNHSASARKMALAGKGKETTID